MKYYIRISFILCAALGTFSLANAQSNEDSQAQATSVTEDSGSPGETVQVAFRTVPAADLLGGVSYVNMPELLDKNYFTGSLDNMQAFVGGWTGNSLWGMDDYLVLVDGVPRDANNVLPTEIQQVTFLKGASAVLLYGSRAAKGVVYITTKRGNDGPLNVSVRANTGFHVSKSYPKYLGSAEYMTLYNEALANDGHAPDYTPEQIYRTAEGLNPYKYPDVDFYSSDYLKKVYNRSDITAELSGGDEKSRFYTNIGYYRQGDVFNFGEAKDNYTDRLNVRGNIDLKITKMITAFVNANATFYNSRSANATDSDPDDPNNVDNYWTYAATMRPTRIAPLIPLSYVDQNDLASLSQLAGASNIIDGKYFFSGSSIDQTNIFADYYASGSSKWTSRQFQFDAGLKFDLSNVLEGLTFNTQYGVDYATSYTTSYNNTYAVFETGWNSYNGVDAVTIVGDRIGNDKKSGAQNINNSSTRQTLAFSGYFDYTPTISESHNFSAKLLASGFQQTRTTDYHRTGNANLGLLLNYNYQNKYYVDLGSSLVHSARLPEGNRNGLSTSATLGWRLSQESILKSSSVVDNLMLSVSGTVLKTDLDVSSSNGDFYLYEANYNQSNGQWWGWRDGASERSTLARRGQNYDLTFVDRKEFTANLSASLWDRLITANASFFVNELDGLVIQPTFIFPSYFRTWWPDTDFRPFVNYNSEQRKGIDFTVNVNRQIGEVGVSLGVSGMYYTTKATRYDEDKLVESYRLREGRPVDGLWGLKSMGLFNSQAEIDNSPSQKFGGDTKPGDIRYVDQNGDGRIDEKDEVYLGPGGWNGAPFTGGLHLTAKWKGFTFFALGTMQMGAYAMKDNSYFWVYGNRKYSEEVRGRWTEDTKATASYPRLTTESGVNNFRNSDFWMYKTNRFNLARVQLSYSLPSSLLEKTFLGDVSIYVSGSDLLTVSKEREILEMNLLEAPQTRFYNFGVRAAF